MESLAKTLTSTTTAAAAASTTTILSLIHFRRLTNTSLPQSLLTRRRISPRAAVALSSFLLHRPASLRPPRCLSHSSVSFCSGGGGGGGGFGGGGGGGGGGEDRGVPKAANVDDVSPASPDAIVLDVGGMTCGGCAAKVKKILENQPQVSSATVNLATETAIVWPVTEATAVPNWRQELGEILAKHLTNCGFESNARGQGENEGEIPEGGTQQLL